MKSYKEIMRGLRQDKDLKQIQIANVLGTSQQHYSKYETGEYELPLHALNTLANFYDVSTDYIIGRTACKQGVTGLNEKINADCTVGEVISDILSLGTTGRAAVIEYIALQKMKEASTKKKTTHP